MSRKLAVVLFSMLILTGAVGLKSLIASHANGANLVAVGPMPAPIRPPQPAGGN